MEKVSFQGNFSLKYSFECGQFFCYFEKEGWYYVFLPDKIFKVKQIKNEIFFVGISKDELVNFLFLNFNLDEIIFTFNDLNVLRAVQKYKGIRILKQELWQCLVGFICSQQKSISEIKKTQLILAEKFGDKFNFEGEDFYLFPKPGNLNNLEKLNEAKLGYRKKYLFELNEKILKSPKILEKIKKMNYENSKYELKKFNGVGDKVSDCVCLYSLNHREAFPIDTWVLKILKKYYSKEILEENLENVFLKKSLTKKQYSLIYDFTKKIFKKNIGLQQLYLFCYERNLKF